MLDGFGVSFIEFLDELLCVYVGCQFPTVMCFRETFPSDQVLNLTPMLSNLQNLFYFPFWLPIH